MPRGIQKWDEAKIESLRKAGRGQGEGPSYEPWTKVKDFSSRGTSVRAYSWKLKRIVELFSRGEWHLFLLLEWLLTVLDIREQFPLDRDATMAIALELGIRHPCYPGTHVPAVMTVDFLATRLINGQRRFEAYSYKTASGIDNARDLEKLEIINSYFRSRQIPHHLVLDTALPETMVRNIEWLRYALPKPGELEPYPGFLEQTKKQMQFELQRISRSISLGDYCSGYDTCHGLPVGTALRVAKILMYEHALVSDMNNPHLVSCPLASFRLSSDSTHSNTDRRA